MASPQATISNAAELKHAPQLPSKSILGHLQMLLDDPLKKFSEARQEYGDIVGLRLGKNKAFLVFHPDMIQQILLTNINNYSKQTRGYHKLRLFLGNGLVTSEGDFWRRQRRIAQPAFMRKRIEGFAETMSSFTERTVEQWRAVPEGETIDVAKAMMTLTLGIAGQTLFSIDTSSDSDAIGPSLTYVLEYFPHLVSAPYPYPEWMPTLANLKFHRSKRQIYHVIDDIIAKRQQNKEERHNDLLDMFMAVEDEETGEKMNAQQLRDECTTMLLAGHETTANAITWAFYALSKRPDIKQRLQHELDTVLEGRSPTLEDLKQLPYLSNVFKETLRLYPPIWSLARRAVEDDTVSGYHIPADSFIFLSQYVTHRHPDFWQDPETFDPERWTPERVEARKQISSSRFVYFPFSLGQRKCIGDHFAHLEGEIILAILLQHFDFEISDKVPVVLKPSITLRPKDGIHIHLIPRS
ncbi:MAG: cytochrome P450 [Deltaproteobacteria bacterium]|nr:cytochrome P450 [Deltaproteobacteria bacterium]MBU47955.1 cytochrome P450 [Deltaproteobacteria bacterium]